MANLEVKRPDNLVVHDTKDIKAPEPSPAAPKLTNHDVIEKLSKNLASHLQSLNIPKLDDLKITELLKLSAAQKILALKQMLVPRIHAIDSWVEDMLKAHNVMMLPADVNKVVRFLQAMCEIAEL